MSKELHVSINGNDKNNGAIKTPFKTINHAAKIAMPGDTILIHEGTYREWVKPANSGMSEKRRITYKNFEDDKVVIKGSEEVTDWEKVNGTVWKKTLDNSFFGEFNPYEEELHGDWLVWPLEKKIHLGDVYLNGKSFYEATSYEDVEKGEIITEGYNPPWTKHPEPMPEPEFTKYKWYTETDDDTTTIYANFHEYNPNEEFIEINVRPYCFYPELTGRNYITVSGLEMAQAACPWTPPTADQPGLIGANWSKGWIIENNIIHDAKCSAISIGKEALTGHNECTYYRRKPGYQNQMESVFKALKTGWSEETIGSHIIRNNTIYDCGQNGVVGHLGCVFSEIYNNHIYNIGTKHEYFGYEIAGIKLHAAIDVQIHNNNIHDCTLGTWLDWQAQGTRVSQNLFYNNDRDLMIEVTHGPHTVDNNIFASAYNFDNIAQGGAYINNLFCGTMRREPVLNRATPYHLPHSTDVLSTTFVYGGDDRFYQNIFIGGAIAHTEQSVSGLETYNGSPTSLEEYIEEVNKHEGDLEAFELVKEPAYIKDNAYLNDATPFEKDMELILKYNPNVKIYEEDGSTYIEFDIDEKLANVKGKIYKTEDLESVRIVNQNFENPDSSDIIFNKDYNNKDRAEQSAFGPFDNLSTGVNKIKVW